MNEEDIQYQREILSNLRMKLRVFYGKPGVAMLTSLTIAVLCFNCFVWIVPFPNLGGPRLLAPEYQSLMPLSVCAMVLFCGSMISLAFISALATMNPPPENARNYFPLIMAVVAFGILMAAVHPHTPRTRFESGIDPTATRPA